MDPFYKAFSENYLASISLRQYENVLSVRYPEISFGDLLVVH